MKKKKMELWMCVYAIKSVCLGQRGAWREAKRPPREILLSFYEHVKPFLPPISYILPEVKLRSNGMNSSPPSSHTLTLWHIRAIIRNEPIVCVKARTHKQIMSAWSDDARNTVSISVCLNRVLRESTQIIRREMERVFGEGDKRMPY